MPSYLSRLLLHDSQADDQRMLADRYSRDIIQQRAEAEATPPPPAAPQAMPPIDWHSVTQGLLSQWGPDPNAPDPSAAQTLPGASRMTQAAPAPATAMPAPSAGIDWSALPGQLAGVFGKPPEPPSPVAQPSVNERQVNVGVPSALNTAPSAPGSAPTSWEGKAYAAAQAAGHPNPSEFVEQIRQESGGNPNAVSPAGARGIAQIMPATAAGWGVNPLDPDAALAAAAQHMAEYYKKYGDSDRALAAYNMGEGNLQKYGPHGLPETHTYITRIQGATGTAQPPTPGEPGGPPLQTTYPVLRSAPPTREGASDDVAQAALDDPDKWALCGPVAATIAAQRYGPNWTVAQAKALAVKSGLWDASTGMHGLESEATLLRNMGIASRTGAANEQALASDAQAGNTPIISTNRHYFILKGYNPETREFDTSTTGTVLKGGRRWLTLDEIASLGGGIQGAAFMDNPTTPQPSAVAGPSPNAAAVSPAAAEPSSAPVASGSPPDATGAPVQAMSYRMPLQPTAGAMAETVSQPWSGTLESGSALPGTEPLGGFLSPSVEDLSWSGQHGEGQPSLAVNGVRQSAPVGPLLDSIQAPSPGESPGLSRSGVVSRVAPGSGVEASDRKPSPLGDGMVTSEASVGTVGSPGSAYPPAGAFQDDYTSQQPLTPSPAPVAPVPPPEPSYTQQATDWLSALPGRAASAISPYLPDVSPRPAETPEEQAIQDEVTRQQGVNRQAALDFIPNQIQASHDLISRWQVLNDKAMAARFGQGPPLTPEEQAEYQELNVGVAMGTQSAAPERAAAASAATSVAAPIAERIGQGVRSASQGIRGALTAGSERAAALEAERATAATAAQAAPSAERIGSGVVPSLRSAAYNAAQGGVLGAASEDAQAQAEGREPDPTQRLVRGAIGAGLAVVAGSRAGRRVAAEELGAGFVAGPHYRPPSAAKVQAEANAGAKAGRRLNQPISVPGTGVPGRILAATAATDDRAALRWSEDMLTDAAGTPRLRENDPLRPSTQSRVNSGAVASERIQSDLEPAVISAAKAGLADELPQYTRDMHARDILDEFYGRGEQEAITAGADKAQAHLDAVDKVVKARLDAAERRAVAIEKDAGKSKAQAYLGRVNQTVKDRLSDAEIKAKAFEKAGDQAAADSTRRIAQNNASQTMTAATENADRMRQAGPATAQAEADGVRRSAQNNASQTMTRAQTVADSLKATPAQIATGGLTKMRTRQGANPDMTYEALDARLKGQEQRVKAKGTWQQLQDSAQAIWDHNAETRQRLVDAGEIDPADAAYWAQAYPHYVPTVPVSHLDARTGGPVATSGGPRVSRGNQKVTHALEDVGTSGEQLNPIVATRNATIRAERAIGRNNTAAAFAQMMDDALQASPGTMATNAATHRTFLGGGTDVTYMANGKQQTISVPKAVADGLEAAANMSGDPGTMGRIWKQIMGTVTSAMTAARASFLPVNLARDAQDYAARTATLEGGPQKMPGVMGTWLDEAGKAVADVARAQFTGRGAVGAATGAAAGAAIGDESTTPQQRVLHAAEGGIAGLFLGGANKVRPTGAAKEFLARGGGSGGVSAHWVPGQRWYRDVLRDGGAPVRNASDAARYLGDWMSDIGSLQGIKGINERGELISRTAAMRRAENVRGLSPTESMIAGRDASYDPDRAGTVARMVNGVVPFFNASVQNAAQTARLFRDNPVAATATIGATVAPVMLGVEAWNRSDPTRAQVYDDVPQYLKDSGLVVVTPWAGSDARGDRPNYIWIPTGVQTPFVVGMRKAMENLPGLEPTAGRVGAGTDASAAAQWGDILSTTAQMFSPVRGESASGMLSNLVPQGVKQGIEIGINRDLYRGTPIVTNAADERASAASRSVAEGANELGRRFGFDWLQEVHPSQVEHLAQALPAYNDIVSGASDMVAPSGYKSAEDRPVANEPFLGGIASRFIRDTGGANLQRSQDDSLPDVVRPIFEEAGLRPSDMGTVPSTYKGAPLTRDEQLAWQEATNNAMSREVQAATRSSEWRQRDADKQQIVRDAMAKARETAANRVLRRVDDREIERRIRLDEARKAG